MAAIVEHQQIEPVNKSYLIKMSVDLSSITNIGIIVPDRHIVVDGNLRMNRRCGIQSNNVHTWIKDNQVEVKITDSDQNSFTTACLMFRSAALLTGP